MHTTNGAQRGDHVLGNFAFVKALAAFGGDAAQRFSHHRVTEQMPDLRRLATVGEELTGRTMQVVMVVGPVEPDPRGDRDAFFGIVYRGRKNGIQTKPPVILGQAAERIHGAGNGNGFRPTEERHLVETGGAQVRTRQRCRCPTGPVEAEDVFGPGRFDHDKAIAPDPGHRRFAQPQQNSACNRSIDGIAALLQDVDCCLRCQWVRCGAHTVCCHHRRAAWHVEITHVSCPSVLPRKIGGRRGASIR